MAAIPVDLAVVRAARLRLQQLAKEHPELTGPSGPGNRADWKVALMEAETMTPVTKTTGFRLSDQLLERIDAHAEQLSELAGVPVSRAAVVVKLLTERLDQIGAAAGKKKPTKK